MISEVKRDYYKSGQIKYERYYENGELHRLNSSAYIDYYENGQIRGEVYCENDKRHRLDGPAEIWYHKDGEIGSEYYYINDKRFSKEEFYSHPQVVEYLENQKFYKVVEEVLGD